MSRTFDELIRTALLDLARQAEPVELTELALADAARQRRMLLASGAAAAVLAVGAGTVAAIAEPSPPGSSRPRTTSPSPTGAPSMGQVGPTCETGPTACADTTPSTPITAPSSSPPSKRPPGLTEPTPTSSDDRPGNRPHPKPTKPHG